MSNFENSITTAKQHINFILAEQREKEYGSTLEAATHLAARSQATSEAAKENEPLNRKERAKFNQQVLKTTTTTIKHTELFWKTFMMRMYL